MLSCVVLYSVVCGLQACPLPLVSQEVYAVTLLGEYRSSARENFQPDVFFFLHQVAFLLRKDTFFPSFFFFFQWQINC